MYSFVAAAIEKRGSAQSELEVEIPIGDPKQIRWVAGALDSLFGAPDQSRAQIKARSVVAAINNVLRHPNEGNATHLYRLLSNDGTISIIDEVLPRVAEQLGDRRPQLAKLSRRLVRESPDVEPVKSGIALLGISGTPEDADLLFRMGHFEELTVYSVVALAHLLPEPEVQIWQLTKNVHGWGRIQAVHRLSATKNPEIKAWMLREGFKNRIMYEYLAYTCATAGELLEALSAPAPDDALLDGAGHILTALFNGGPAENIMDYGDGAAACVRYLQHMAKRPAANLDTYVAARAMRTFVEDDKPDWAQRGPAWSAQTRWDIRSEALVVLQKPEWVSLVSGGLQSEDEQSFYWSSHIAPDLGIDPWPYMFERQRARTSSQWFFLMQTPDPTRVDQVLELARQQLDLELVGSGPTDSMGLGHGYEDDSAADFIVQDLKRFPGKGWDLIRVGLRGRSIRLRNMALNALNAWDRDAWPSDARAALEAAREREPDDEIRARISRLLEGPL